MLFVHPLLVVGCDDVEGLLSVVVLIQSLSDWRCGLFLFPVTCSSITCLSAIKSLKYSTVFSSHMPPEWKISEILQIQNPVQRYFELDKWLSIQILLYTCNWTTLVLHCVLWCISSTRIQNRGKWCETGSRMPWHFTFFMFHNLAWALFFFLG